MKLKPNDPLNLHIKNAKRLGFDKLSVLQLKLVLTMLLAKNITSTKAAITCLGILVVQKGEIVVYINLKPFEI
jgi:hypothetical protein